MLNSVTTEFGDGTYRFCMGLPHVCAVQMQAGMGIGEVAQKLFADHWYAETLIEIIRQGLIGGNEGMVNGLPVEVNSIKANQLIETYVIGQPMNEWAQLARVIMSAALIGYEPEDEGLKKNGEISQEESPVD